MGSVIDRLDVGLDVVCHLAAERPPLRWSEQVVPCGLAGSMLVTPGGWTLTEETQEVRLRQV